MENEIKKKKKSNDNSSSNKSSISFVKFSFLIFGISSLLEWNAILSDIDFFNDKQKSIHPNYSFSFFNSLFNIVIQFILVYKPKPFQYKKQLLFTLISTFFILIFLPLFVILFNKKSDNFPSLLITIILILFGGLCNALGSSGFFGLCSYFPLELIINMSTGQGIAGILMNAIQYLILLLNSSENTKALFFFGIASLFILFCIFIIIKVYRIPFFFNFLKNTDEIDNSIIVDEEISELTDETKSTHNKSTPEQKEESFLELTKQIIDINILIVILYTTTFILFPGVCLAPDFFGLNDTKSITIIAIYNISDTLGRYIVNYLEPTKNKAYVFILSRLSLIFIMPFTYYLEQKNKSDLLISLILLLCVIYLGITNGIGTSLCFGLAPKFVKEHMKGKAGSSVSFFLIVGIFIGSCLALIMEVIMDKIKK